MKSKAIYPNSERFLTAKFFSSYISPLFLHLCYFLLLSTFLTPSNLLFLNFLLRGNLGIHYFWGHGQIIKQNDTLFYALPVRDIDSKSFGFIDDI